MAYEDEAHTQQCRVKRGGGVMKIESLPFGPMTESLRNNTAQQIGRLAKRWALVFCQVEAAPMWRVALEQAGLVYKRTCIWVKPDGMPQYSGDRPGMGYETILAMHVPGRSVWNGGGQNGVFTYNKNESRGLPNEHPTTKPLTLIKKLVFLFSNEGELIADPFLGSGTTAVACESMDRKWLGVELEDKYISLANSRVSAERSQGRLL